MTSTDRSDARPRTRPSAMRRVRAVGLALLVVAAARELAKPSATRTWHGTLGPVPYDLRRPTLARLRERVWNHDDPRLITPRVFGVGWTLNLARLVGGRRRAGGAGSGPAQKVPGTF